MYLEVINQNTKINTDAWPQGAGWESPRKISTNCESCVHRARARVSAGHQPCQQMKMVHACVLAV